MLFAAVVEDAAAWLTRLVIPDARSHTNTSSALPASVTPLTRLVAVLENATVLPSVLSARYPVTTPLAAVPPAAWLTSVIAPVVRSQTKASLLPFVSVAPVTRSVAGLWNATQAPSPLITGKYSAGWLPVSVAEVVAWLTSAVVPVTRSHRKMSWPALASLKPATRSVAGDVNTRNRPSPLNAKELAPPFAPVAAVPTACVTSVELPVVRSHRYR